MGNCQAIDAATLVVQHPSGKVDKLYWPVPASEIMKMNPGHYVALLITTTVCHTTPKPETNSPTKPNNHQKTTPNSHKNSTTSQKNTSTNGLKNSTTSSKGSDSKTSNTSTGGGDGPNTVRITRVKLLRPTDTLALGHVYRLISTKEVMKGLVAKKQAKMRKSGIELADSEGLKEAEKLARRSQQDKTHQGSRHGHRSRTSSTSNGGTTRPKTWQPSLHSISEATS